MKGRNEIRMNEATVIEAVQEYLDARHSKDSPLVTGFAKVSGSHVISGGDMYVVATEEKEAEDE